jgi:hypothetical protein
MVFTHNICGKKTGQHVAKPETWVFLQDVARFARRLGTPGSLLEDILVSGYFLKAKEREI